MKLVFAAAAVELVLYIFSYVGALIFGLSIAAVYIFLLIILIIVLMALVFAWKIKAPLALITLNISGIAIPTIFIIAIIIGCIFFMEELYAYIVYVYIYAICYVSCLVEIFLSVGVPLLQAVLWKHFQRYNTSSQSNSDSELSKLLADETGFKLFSNFAASEWSSENVTFFSEFAKLKQLPTKQQQLQQLKEQFYSLYISSDGQLCLNIDSAARNQVKECIKTFSHSPTPEEEQYEKLLETYEQVMKEVYFCMSDTFSRFIPSATYKKWYQHHQSTISVSNELGWKEQ